MQQSLAERLAALEADFEAYKALSGVSIDKWMQPHKVERLVNLAKSRINKLIDAAEESRAANKRCSLVYGKHYRLLPPNSSRQIDWRAWNDLLNSLPIEQWEGVD